jgi:hypothetical protein
MWRSGPDTDRLRHGHGPTVTIYRDRYGVPYVHGPTDSSAVFGFAYAQAEDNFSQIEDSYIHALGRAAEAYGGSKVAEDWLNRALEVASLSRAEDERLGPRARQLCDAFGAGLNYFLASHPKVKPRLLTRFESWHSGAAPASPAPARIGRGVRAFTGRIESVGRWRHRRRIERVGGRAIEKRGWRRHVDRGATPPVLRRGPVLRRPSEK